MRLYRYIKNSICCYIALMCVVTFNLYAQGHSLNKPNIILIMADDLGFSDLAVYGNTVVETPNLDALAKQSVQFSDFSVTPVCATTRAALLTGKHPYKVGVSGVHGGRDYLALEHTLISQVLQHAGYKTAMWGKWHSGKSEGYLPWQRGFDEAYYAELYQHKNTYGWLNGEPVQHQNWVSPIITDYAIDFIKRQGEQPYFAFLSYLAPHEPWLAPEKFVEKYRKKGLREATANLYGMIEEMDAEIGRLIEFLHQTDRIENTVVLFISDNGAWWGSSNLGAMLQEEWQQRNPLKLKGWKARNWQNGVRSPLFVYSPKHLEARTEHHFVDITDLAPTFADWAESEMLANVDGFSIKPLLQNNAHNNTSKSSLSDAHKNRVSLISTHDVVAEQANFNQWTPISAQTKKSIKLEKQMIALRNAQYKLVLNPIRDDNSYPQAVDSYVLIDIKNDPTESVNLMQTRPDIARTMQAQLAAQFDEILNYAGSFKPPVHYISASELSVLNAFAPAEVFGNTVSKAHFLTNLHKKGDGAIYHINVVKRGEYDVYVHQQNYRGAGFNIKLGTANTSITRTLTAHPYEYVGQLSLSPSDQTLQLEVVGIESMNLWSSIEQLRHIVLVPKGVAFDPDLLSVPK
ncbi:sulfatase-like hydrolase/transferase [Catenovulum sediminis]|uniref:Sulfatase-like hydrolase/transferase n=1 Tax=Catenovulum sediminis TaxID=1740262 RepID=A0ABV1RC93_9ALTE